MPNAKKFPFRIGADPEFNFVVQNRHSGRLRADKLMEDFFSDQKSHNMGYNIEGGNAGWDGNASTGELRPKPEFTPKGLTENIGMMYSEISKRSPRAIKMSVRSDTAPVGGHIHFELDNVSKIMSAPKIRTVQKRLSTFYIPIALGEDKANQALRLQSSYGRFNDGRRENGATFEYRTPSAEWQITPKICASTLAYLATVWFEAVHRPKTFSRLESVYSNDRAGNAIQQLLLTRYPIMTNGIVNELKKAIKNFEYYPMFKEEIDYIMNYDKVLKDKEKAMFCINLGWGFQESNAPTKKLINNEAQINRNLSNIDVDRWLELFKIPYNPDNNVKEFIDALKKRILAYDWNLKNEYYMFGMKKGIKKPIFMNGDFEVVVGAEQIETIRDRDVIVDSFQRMKRRMTRTARRPVAQSIIVGIPYEYRVKKTIRPIVEQIYDLERIPEEFETNQLKTSELRNDLEDDSSTWGTIAQAYLQNNEEVVMEAAPPNRPNEMSMMLEEEEEEEDESDQNTMTGRYERGTSGMNCAH